jgi:hypothetical protein
MVPLARSAQLLAHSDTVPEPSSQTDNFDPASSCRLVDNSDSDLAADSLTQDYFAEGNPAPAGKFETDQFEMDTFEMDTFEMDTLLKADFVKDNPGLARSALADTALKAAAHKPVDRL